MESEHTRRHGIGQRGSAKLNQAFSWGDRELSLTGMVWMSGQWMGFVPLGMRTSVGEYGISSEVRVIIADGSGSGGYLMKRVSDEPESSSPMGTHFYNEDLNINPRDAIRNICQALSSIRCLCPGAPMTWAYSLNHHSP